MYSYNILISYTTTDDFTAEDSSISLKTHLDLVRLDPQYKAMISCLK